MQFWIVLIIPFYWLQFAVPKSYKITIVSFLYARLGSLERCAHECSGRGVCPSRSTWWRRNFVVRFMYTLPSSYLFLAHFFCLHVKRISPQLKMLSEMPCISTKLYPFCLFYGTIYLSLLILIPLG